MLDNKNIHDIFEQANLQNEDWLQPTDKVLKDIEATIYPKKRLRWLWVILPMLLLLGGTAVYYYVDKPLEQSPKVVENTLNKTEDLNRKKVSESKVLSKPITNKNENSLLPEVEKNIGKRLKQKKNSATIKEGILAEKDNLGRSDAESNKGLTKKNQPKKLKSGKTSIKKDKVKLTNSNTNLPVAATVTNQNLKELKPENVRIEGLKKGVSIIPGISKYLKRPNYVANTSTHVSLIERANQVIASKKMVKESKKQIVHRLVSKEPDLINHNHHALLKNNSSNILPDQSKDLRYQFSTGFSSWNCQLNPEFSKALKPVGFTYNTGKGFYVSAGLEKKINQRIAIKGNLQYEQVLLYSNHQTSQWYYLEDEINQTNTLKIDIASPLGFTNTELTVKRTNNALDQNTELNIDLNNSHQIFTVDAGISLSAQFVKFVKLSAETVFQTGIHQVILVDNKLRSVETNNIEFEALTNTKLNQQTGLNTTRPYFGLGLHINYQINTTQAIQFQYAFKQNVLPLYKAGDYKSYLSRQQLGLSYLIQF